ncbi:MAG: HD domain-containing protein [Candidatus Omnitrophica bacterium]|nr:HD domain-containing protein [Candidatus Omnitrophota bacterium]
MRKINTTFNLAAFFLMQAFIFVNACFASGSSFINKVEGDCLSPALQIGKNNLPQIYFSLRQNGDIESAGLRQHKENGDYKKLLERLIKQFGTADELLDEIKVRYKDEFGRAIENLEEEERKYSADNGDWIVEHEKEVTLMSYCMGRILGFGERRLAGLVIAARFHDIGKCEKDPRAINNKSLFTSNRFLTKQEKESVFAEMNKHSERAYFILEAAGIKDEVILEAVLNNHANLDGSGYPIPITRQEILLEAKINRVPDSFSGMLGRRPYPRPYHSVEMAAREIENNVYSLFGPRAVKTFQSMLSDKEITNRREEFYHIPLREGAIFRDLLKEAEKIDAVYPFAKVACGISNNWNEKPYSFAVNSIDTHRHAEVNLILKVLDEQLRRRGLRKQYMKQLRQLEFLAYTAKLNESAEANTILRKLLQAAGDPFKDKVIYVTLRPCEACFKLLGLIGIKEIYYGSEHVDSDFILKSENAAEELRKKGMRIARAHFHNEGVLEPNELFFAFCNQPGYEKITETVNSWFAEIIKHTDTQKLSIDIMKKKEREFAAMLGCLLGSLDAQADIKQVNEILLQARETIMGPRCLRHPESSSLNNQDLLLQAI